METFTKTTKEKLKRVSIATIASCLYKKRLKNKFIQDVKPLKPIKPTMFEKLLD